MPETFSSELGDVHEPDGAHSSFTNEFRGASDSLIERDRPPRPLDVGRRARRVLFLVVLLAASLGGGGWALWYWSAEVGEWIASWRGGDQAPPAAASSEPIEQPEPAPSEPEPSEPERVFGIKGAPAGSEAHDEIPSPPSPIDTLPVEPGEELPVDSWDTPSKPASVTSGATSVRGRVATAAINSKLAAVDTALERCWASAAVKPETKRPATITLRFDIKWNGRTFAITVDGDAPESVSSCVRTALPSSGWPQPRDGGEATITRSWSLE